jgi:uracil-DNA glycosylase
MALSDRILVCRPGKMVGEFSAGEAMEESIMYAAIHERMIRNIADRTALQDPDQLALDQLLVDIRACVNCAAFLPLGPRPVVQAGLRARLLIIGQAPGVRVHETGTPWDDASGERLREWIGIDRQTFYDPAQVAIVAMGFCYPGRAASGGDAPPRRECAPLWHGRLLGSLGALRLTLLVGQYAQKAYLASPGASMTETVRAFRTHLPGKLPLPHPSWRSTGWMRRNPWFTEEVLPAVREQVQAALD